MTDPTSRGPHSGRSPSTDTSPLEAMADSLAGTFPGCEDAPLALALLRELARGEPVPAHALAASAARQDADVQATLARWPNVQRDDHDRIVAFGGLTLRPTAHRFEVGGPTLYAWCAWDTLFLPALLDQTAHVRSRCPITGVDVRLTVTPGGVREAAPAGLVVSFPPPGAARVADITGSFCCHVHFLAGPQAADRWRAAHDGALALTLSEAFELGRLSTRAMADGIGSWCAAPQSPDARAPAS
jgi:alkylmercury lyase